MFSELYQMKRQICSSAEGNVHNTWLVRTPLYPGKFLMMDLGRR